MTSEDCWFSCAGVLAELDAEGVAAAQDAIVEAVNASPAEPKADSPAGEDNRSAGSPPGVCLCLDPCRFVIAHCQRTACGADVALCLIHLQVMSPGARAYEEHCLKETLRKVFLEMACLPCRAGNA